MNNSFEKSKPRSRTFRAASLLATTGLLAGGLSACNNDAPNEYTFVADGTTWLVKCDKNDIENNQITAEAGDTLLSLAHKTGTEMQQPIDLGAAEVPAVIFAKALAKYAGIENPDMIYAEHIYNLPAFCEELPVK